MLPGNMAQAVSDKAYQDAQGQLDEKGDRGLDQVDGIHYVGNGQTDGSADASVERADQKSAQGHKSVAQMDRDLASPDGGDGNGKEGKDDIGKGCKNAGKDQLSGGFSGSFKAAPGGSGRDMIHKGTSFITCTGPPLGRRPGRRISFFCYQCYT